MKIDWKDVWEDFRIAVAFIALLVTLCLYLLVAFMLIGYSSTVSPLLACLAAVVGAVGLVFCISLGKALLLALMF
jgi:hypothetical protein